MRISVPREIKPEEARVGLTPTMVTALVAEGHEVFVAEHAGEGAGFSDESYRAAGARITSQEDTWAQAELLVKVKEPIASEYDFLRPDLTLFTYLHLAASRSLTEALLDRGTTGIAYETVRVGRTLPLLRPMSEIAGRLAIANAAHHLQHHADGPGILLGRVPGVVPATVLVIGGGTVGEHAARAAVGAGADVTILEANGDRLRQLDALFPHARVLMSDTHRLDEELPRADVVVGSVLVPGASAPKLVRREHLSIVKPHALLVDVAVDQGGCFETTRPTTYDDPVYAVDGIRHYCVANLPGAVPVTATQSLTHATSPYVMALARGVDSALENDAALAAGLSTRAGQLHSPGVAAAFPDLPAAS